jgi:hypothetical protein
MIDVDVNGDVDVHVDIDDVVVVDDDNDHCESGQTMASDRASTTASTSNGSNSNN